MLVDSGASDDAGDAGPNSYSRTNSTRQHSLGSVSSLRSPFNSIGSATGGVGTIQQSPYSSMGSLDYAHTHLSPFNSIGSSTGATRSPLGSIGGRYNSVSAPQSTTSPSNMANAMRSLSTADNSRMLGSPIRHLRDHQSPNQSTHDEGVDGARAFTQLLDGSFDHGDVESLYASHHLSNGHDGAESDWPNDFAYHGAGDHSLMVDAVSHNVTDAEEDPTLTTPIRRIPSFDAMDMSDAVYDNLNRSSAEGDYTPPHAKLKSPSATASGSNPVSPPLQQQSPPRKAPATGPTPTKSAWPPVPPAVGIAIQSTPTNMNLDARLKESAAIRDDVRNETPPTDTSFDESRESEEDESESEDADEQEAMDDSHIEKQEPLSEVRRAKFCCA